jgi:hypothetical protein
MIVSVYAGNYEFIELSTTAGTHCTNTALSPFAQSWKKAPFLKPRHRGYSQACPGRQCQRPKNSPKFQIGHLSLCDSGRPPLSSQHLVVESKQAARNKTRNEAGDDAMKILLQHMKTNLYLRSLGSWTDNPEEAHDFKHSKRLLDFVYNNGLEGVQIAVKFLENQFDEIFPIPAGQAAVYARA